MVKDHPNTCQLLKKNFVDKTMKKLINQDGNVVTDQQKILQEVENYYRLLFKENKNIETKKFDSLKNQNIFRSLTSEESKQLQGELTVKELGSALTKMKNVKNQV